MEVVRETVKVGLTPREYTALARLCAEELRPIPDQVRLLVRRELRRRRLLEPEQPVREQRPEGVRHA
ncbi:MAG TPA: hypothetical protein PLJ35_20015 [Anaerolineae bacterium]|nr:hypothetical protein [Anaerolineae bacterium]HPL28309.1 hypothetical protein [Anaerolineae bacterium]